jgi:hypothetical protein
MRRYCCERLNAADPRDCAFPPGDARCAWCSNGCLIEAPWLVHGGHGASIRQPFGAAACLIACLPVDRPLSGCWDWRAVPEQPRARRTSSSIAAGAGRRRLRGRAAAAAAAAAAGGRAAAGPPPPPPRPPWVLPPTLARARTPRVGGGGGGEVHRLLQVVARDECGTTAVTSAMVHGPAMVHHDQNCLGLTRISLCLGLSLCVGMGAVPGWSDSSL